MRVNIDIHLAITQCGTIMGDIRYSSYGTLTDAYRSGCVYEAEAMRRQPTCLVDTMVIWVTLRSDRRKEDSSFEHYSDVYADTAFACYGLIISKFSSPGS